MNKLDDDRNILEIKNVSVCLEDKIILNKINLNLVKGEVLGIVGESGSGKTTLMNTLVGLLDKKWKVEGEINLFTEKLGLIPQNYYSSFNPMMRISSHFFELMPKEDKTIKREQTISLLKKVAIDNPERVLELYPFQLSGGMLQRINIALSLLVGAELIIADEATSSLDIATQNEIIELLKRINISEKKTIIVVSHDLEVIKKLANKIAVIYKGEIIECKDSYTLFSSPEKEYTRLLLSTLSKPTDKKRSEKFDSKENVLLEARDISKAYGKKEILKAVNLKVYTGKNLGILGKSGSGKSTLARIIVGLEKQSEGEVYLNGELLDELGFKKYRKKIQIVFQDGKGSLNPYRDIKSILLDVERDIIKIEGILGDVALSKDILDKYPRQLSGGQAQRICIARALLANPDILILDEPTSSLDKVIQIEVLKLLGSIGTRNRVTYIMISHDIGAIKELCEEIVFLSNGILVNKKIDNLRSDEYKNLYE